MHYRVTRPQAYGENTPGRTKPSARQGYYTDAESVTEARRIIRKRHGFEYENLDVQAWDNGPDHGKLLDVGGNPIREGR